MRVANAQRGVVGIGLGRSEGDYPPQLYERAFAEAKDAGLGSVPHAGEADGPPSVRGALDVLRPTGSGTASVRRRTQACCAISLTGGRAGRLPTSNLRTGVVRALAEHPLPELLAAGVQCTINTDDPALFGTDLGSEYATALGLGVSPQGCYAAGVCGALCDASMRAELKRIGAEFDWERGTDPARLGPASTP